MEDGVEISREPHRVSWEFSRYVRQPENTARGSFGVLTGPDKTSSETVAGATPTQAVSSTAQGPESETEVAPYSRKSTVGGDRHSVGSVAVTGGCDLSDVLIDLGGNDTPKGEGGTSVSHMTAKRDKDLPPNISRPRLAEVREQSDQI
ncbi:hypothetical protein Bbelb_189830 [Branchiostoma belcheri]|nr:hypothetical protein Bbelb_189830 [Branchiostoma belcheri]